MQKAELRKRYIIILLGCILLIVLDQIVKFYIINNISISKTIIPNILKFTYTTNKGGAFGIGQNSLLSVIISNLIVIGIIIKFIITQQSRITPKINIILSFIIAGGLSNLFDRIVRGFVIDYIDVTPIFNFPKFNLADIYIVIAWVCLIVYFIIEIINNKKKNTKQLVEGNEK